MTPADRLEAGSQLLRDIDDQPESPTAQRVLTQAAIAHALLGLLEIEIDDRAPVHVREVSTEKALDWFVTTDLFSRCGSIVAGPFTTSDDARVARKAIEKAANTDAYWIDCKTKVTEGI